MSSLLLRSDNCSFTYKKVIQMHHEGNSGQAAKNFGLSEEEFDEMKDMLVQGKEHLFERAFLAHFEFAMTYVINKFSCTRNDAYDTTMDVLIEFRQRIIAEKVKYGNLSFLFTQMCSQRYQRKMKKTLDTSEYKAFLTNPDEPIDEDLFIILDKAIEKMGDKCKQLIGDIYFNDKAYKDLEKNYKTTAASLRKQKERCITKLKMLIRPLINN